jgi:hypothetical protein
VLESVYSGISRPDIGELFDQLSSASTYEEFACLKGAEGNAGLMQFMQLDLHDAVTLATDGAVARRLVRAIAGNPVAIAKMTRHLGDGGSYAPDRRPAAAGSRDRPGQPPHACRASGAAVGYRPAVAPAPRRPEGHASPR